MKYNFHTSAEWQTNYYPFTDCTFAHLYTVQNNHRPPTYFLFDVLEFVNILLVTGPTTLYSNISILYREPEHKKKYLFV